MRRIFINYRRQDSEGYVGRLHDHLTQQLAGDAIFMDVDSIVPGSDFVQAIEDEVSKCDVFIAIIGPTWLTAADDDGTRRLDHWNDFVRLEIATAIKHNKRIIPVLVGRARMPNPDQLPEDISLLARRSAIELSHARFVQDTAQLAQTIRTLVPAEQLMKAPSNIEDVHAKEVKLKKLLESLIRATDSPLYSYRTQNRLMPVLGEGYADANILFIGEAPGKNEAQSSRPFCGPSGDVLDEMLRGVKLKREDVYLTNVLHDQPSAKREPTKEELAFYTPILDQLIDIIQPRVIATLGRFAMDYMLRRVNSPERGRKISELHGMLIHAPMPYGDIHLLPLFHPAVVLYTASQKDILRQDFEKLKLFI